MRVTSMGPVFLILPCLWAQDFTHFEVASIRPSPPSKLAVGLIPAPNIRGGIGTDDPGQITYEGIQLASLIVQAFGVEGFQLVFSNPKDRPSPLARFDIVAKIPPGATKRQFNVMLQNLLAERFHLRLHHEMRDTDVFALVVGPDGPKLKEAPPQNDAPRTTSGAPITVGKGGFAVLPPGFTGVLGMPKPGRMYLSARNVQVSEWFHMIQPSGGRPIVDQTGLTGHYDFDVEFEWLRGRGPQAADTPEDAAQSVFTMVEHDMGLKLIPKKVPFDHLVIDGIDKEPTEN